jgi:hypothetical protein
MVPVGILQEPRGIIGASNDKRVLEVLDRAGRLLTVSELLRAVESCGSSITRPIAQLESSDLRLIDATHCIPRKKGVL